MKIQSANPYIQSQPENSTPSQPPATPAEPKDTLEPGGGDPTPPPPNNHEKDEADLKSMWSGFKMGALVGGGLGAATGGAMGMNPVTGALAGAGMGVGGAVAGVGLAGFGAVKLWQHQWKNNDLPGLWLTGIGSLVAVPLAGTAGWYGGLVGGAILGASGGAGAIIGGALGVACVGAAAGGLVGLATSDGFKHMMAQAKDRKN